MRSAGGLRFRRFIYSEVYEYSKIYREDIRGRIREVMKMNDEDRLIDVLERIDRRLARLEVIFTTDRSYGGSDFSTCLTRIMYGVE